ncbi:AAA family ATPase [Demequina maris]|uniref:AAA family ATPase n=1 Tax=Demequina maris TaxID=1638982 RepID=UPI000785C477|nr:AAA family ATPase [Demequina maris]
MAADQVWKSVQLKNFRAFEDTGSIEYAPITLLFGRNSSGKTSILRAPLLLKQFIEQPPGTEPGFSGSAVDFGSFAETVHAGDRSRDIGIAAELDIQDIGIGVPEDLNDAFGLDRKTRLGQFALDMALHWNMRNSRTVISEMNFRADPRAEAAVALTRTGLDRHSIAIGGGRARKVNGELLPQTLRFSGLRRSGDQLDRQWDYAMFSLGIALELAVTRLVHVGPLRDQPSRAYRTDQVGVAGARDTIDVLRGGGKAARDVVSALKLLKMADGIKIDKLAPGYSAILLKEVRTGRMENLADVGFGVSQVLPIITTLVTTEPGSTVLVEQPELHLHPEAQGNFADVLLDLARSRNIGLVIETHSEHFLLRLQRRVADATIDPEYLTTYFVDAGSVRRANIDRRGRLDRSAVPDGFFEEDWQDLLKLTAEAAKVAE